MSKNLTRKGLALGAVVALGASFFAGTPAFAADLSLAPNAGTTNSVLLGDTFTLKTAATGNTNTANLAALKYEVVNTSGVTVAVTGASNGTTTTETTSDTGTTKVYTPGAVTTTVGQVNTITLNPTTTSTTATFSVTVRSFSDLDASGTVTTGDLVSDAQTITFVNGAEVTPTIALDDPQAGVAPTASITLDKNINLEQTTASSYKFVFVQNGTAATADNATLDSGKAKLNGTHAGWTVAAGDVIGAKVQIVRYDGDTTYATSSTVSKSVLAAGTATGASLTFNNSADVRPAVSGDVNASTINATSSSLVAYANKVVRKGTTAVTFTANFLKNGVKVASGEPVSIVLTEVGANSLDAAAEISVAGKKLTNASTGSVESVTAYTTTNADGKVVVALTSKNGAAGDLVKVTVTDLAGTSISVATSISWAAASAASLVETSAPLAYSTRVVAKGSSFAVAYAVVDEWKQPWVDTANNYQITLTPSAGASFTTIAPVTAGKATATVVDNSVDAGTYNLQALLQKQSGTSAWSNTGLPAQVNSAIKVIAALAVPSTVTLIDTVLADGSTAVATTGVPQSSADLVATDRRVDTNTVADPAFVTTEGAQVKGTVKDASGAAVEGAAVTVALPGAALVSGSVSAIGSLTVYTNASGQFTVQAYSQTAGKASVTVTAGAATATKSITFAGAASTAGKTITVTAAALAQAGRAIDVSALLVDKFGNAVKSGSVTFTATGVGYLAATSAVSTNASGVAATKLIVGADETGDAVITATFTNADGDDVSATKTVTFGATDAQIDFVGKRVTAVASFSKGKTVSFYVDGSKKWSKLSASDAEVVLNYNLKKGKHTVAVKISGGFTTSEVIVVK